MSCCRCLIDYTLMSSTLYTDVRIGIRDNSVFELPKDCIFVRMPEVISMDNHNSRQVVHSLYFFYYIHWHYYASSSTNSWWTLKIMHYMYIDTCKEYVSVYTCSLHNERAMKWVGLQLCRWVCDSASTLSRPTCVCECVFALVRARQEIILFSRN